MDSKQNAEENFWHLLPEEALLSVGSDVLGLTEKAVQERLRKYGANTLKKSSRSSAFILFLLQFKSPVTLLLIIAAGLSFALHDKTDATIILLIVLVSGLLGWWQEKGAANVVEQLMKMVQIKCRVVRNGQDKEIHIEEVVPGDVVLLSAGDVIPGDSLLLESQELFVDEAAFTGETCPVEKNSGVLPLDTPLAQRNNSVFMGSHVISGKAKALVMKTAMQSEFGKISEPLRLKAPETDFERGERRFGYMLMDITMVLVVLIFASNVLLHKPVLDSFLFSMALAVGLTPQLLPAIITVNLATGTRNMAKRQVIVKRLASIENFGSMNIPCSDKTGTITEGRKTFTNTMKYVFMATSANFGNMFSMAGASLFLPLLPKEILLTNLLADFPEITISGDHVDQINIEQPHRRDIRFIQRYMITFGILSSIFDFLTFGVLHYVLRAGESLFQTGWFVESVISASLIVLVTGT